MKPPWLITAVELLGTRETPGGRDNAAIIQWAKDEGGKIAAQYTHDEIPWCALFANHILTKNGFPGTETLWALDFAGKWPCVKLDGPALGAFAPMLRNGGGHITVIAGRTKAGNYVGIGGNQSDSVCYAEFAASRLNKDFWWPISYPLPATGFNLLPVLTVTAFSPKEI